MNVISQEEGRVIVKDKEVIKNTSLLELQNLFEISKIINGCKIHVNGINYEIKIPKVYDFENNRIRMERCYGNNLEIMLRTKKSHEYAVNYVNQILSEFLKMNFLWKDYAPRNILIGDNIISIFDFERGIDNKKTDLLYYFLDNVYEEYSSFLLPKERIFSMNDTLKVNSDKIISFDDINSKRVKKIIKKLGYSDIVPLSIYALAVKMIVINEEPFLIKNNIIYPIIELEEYIMNEGYDQYAIKIIGGYNERIRNI